MGNKLIGIAFIFIGIVFLIFGIVTVYVGNMLSGLVALIPSDISGNFSFLGLLTTGSLVFGIIEGRKAWPRPKPPRQRFNDND